MEPIWIGADPGGDQNFGIAALSADGSFLCATVNCAARAVEWIDGLPAGAGIDAPMWWSGGPSGDRKADQWIRRTFGISGGTVQASNSLRGAALIQGAMFAELLRRRFAATPLTEAHPKALIKAMRLQADGFLSQFGVRGFIGNQHEFDAVVAAVAAREGFSGRWPIDLVTERLPVEQDPSTYHLAPVHYFWPTLEPGVDDRHRHKSKNIGPLS